ncbi:MAG: hypothetical protein IJG37_11515 [Synergistaceae bacterium]|nr:hypothetical protein [Synergistaceae bacterium]
MTSNDSTQYVTVEMYNAGTAATNRHLASIDQTLVGIWQEIRYQERDAEHMQTTIYWGFAILALVVAFVGYLVSLAPIFRDVYKDAREARDERLKREMREIAREEISRAMSVRS